MADEYAFISISSMHGISSASIKILILITWLISCDSQNIEHCSGGSPWCQSTELQSLFSTKSFPEVF